MPVWVTQVADAFEIKLLYLAEGKFIEGVSHDRNDVAIFRVSILVFAKDFPYNSLGVVSLYCVTYPAGSNDSNPAEGRFSVFPVQ